MSAHPYLSTIVPLIIAQEMFGFSRTAFYRFRLRHKINLLPVDRVSLLDVVEAFECERKRDAHTAAARPPWAGNSIAEVEEYRRNLVPLNQVGTVFNIPYTSFWRFRLKHSIKLLSGRYVHVDDVLAGLDAQRRKS